MRLIETETSVPWVVTSRSIRMNPLRRVVSASIRGLVLSLTLAAIHYAARWVDAQEEPGNSIPTLLTTPLSQDQPDSGAAAPRLARVGAWTRLRSRRYSRRSSRLPRSVSPPMRVICRRRLRRCRHRRSRRGTRVRRPNPLRRHAGRIPFSGKLPRRPDSGRLRPRIVLPPRRRRASPSPIGRRRMPSSRSSSIPMDW